MESGDGRGALYDFIYLDRARIASYHAQLTNLGAWTGTTTTEGTSDSKTTTGVAKIPPDVFGGTIAITKGSTDGYQRQYDPHCSLLSIQLND